MFKKLLISLLAGIILLMTLSVPTFAAGLVGAPGPWYSQSFDQWYTKVYGGDQNQIFGERYTNAQVNWIFWSMVSLGINLASGNSQIGRHTSELQSPDHLVCRLLLEKQNGYLPTPRLPSCSP